MRNLDSKIRLPGFVRFGDFFDSIDPKPTLPRGASLTLS
jgi:hypothetical protein